MNVAPTNGSGALIHARWIAAAVSVSLQHDQAGQPEGAARSEEESRSCRAGDEEEDHRVIQALQPPAPRGCPVTAVIQRAGKGHGEGGTRGSPSHSGMVPLL